MNKNTKNLSIIFVIIIGLIGLTYFSGMFSLLMLGSTYYVGDGLSFTSSSSQSGTFYQGCKMNILFDGQYIECSRPGYLCGSGLSKSTCYDTQTIRLEEKHIGQRVVGVEYSGCTCKVNSATGVCEPLFSPYGFSESKTITVKASATSISCPDYQILVNGVCEAKPCTYSSGQTACVSGNFVKYSCYTKDTTTCGSNYVCSSTKGCILRETIQPPTETKISCYKCDGTTLLTESVVACSTGFTTSKPTSCGTIITPTVNDTIIQPPNITPGVDTPKLNIFQKFWNWLKDLFSVN